jgi:hypothetical protein
VRFMLRWLAGKNEAVVEPEIEPLTDKQLECTPQGQVMLLSGARSVYDLNRDEATRLRELRKALARKQTPDERRAAIRAVAGIRPAEKLTAAKLENGDVVERKGYSIEKLIMRTEEGIVLPALHFVPGRPADFDKPENKGLPDVVLYLHEQGKHASAAPEGELEKLALSGIHALAVDLRGSGETHPNPEAKPDALFGGDAKDVMLAYLLGKSYVGMRAEDVLYARGVATVLGERKEPKIKIVAFGRAGVPALHAAGLEPDLFHSVELRNMLASWETVVETPRSVNQLSSAVHGALRVYDLPDLVKLLGDKVRAVEAVDATGKILP